MINENSNNLQKLYIAYFGRPADPSGINYWVSNFKGDIKVISSLLLSNIYIYLRMKIIT